MFPPYDPTTEGAITHSMFTGWTLISAKEGSIWYHFPHVIPSWGCKRTICQSHRKLSWCSSFLPQSKDIYSQLTGSWMVGCLSALVLCMSNLSPVQSVTLPSVQDSWKNLQTQVQHQPESRISRDRRCISRQNVTDYGWKWLQVL